MPSLAERLALLLEVHGDSYRSAAELTGLDHTTLMRVANGDTKSPATIQRIAESYGVPSEWLQGQKDLVTDFVLGLMSRPLQERVRLLWERDRRVAYALNFLQQYDSTMFSVTRLAEVMGMSSTEVRSIVATRHCAVTNSHLERLCEASKLPLDWFRTGLIGREDEEELLTGLANLVLTSLSQRLGADISESTIQSAAKSMV